MKEFMRYLFASALPVLCLLLSGCDHKQLTKLPDTARVRIAADWTEFSEVETPTGMSVRVYGADGKVSRTVLTNDISHADVELPKGFYDVMVFNQSPSEFGTVRFENLDVFSQAAVFAEPTKSAWYKSKAPEQVLTTPEWIGTAFSRNLGVDMDMVYASPRIRSTKSTEYPESNVLCTLVPKNIIYRVTVIVNIRGIHNLKAARASLDGMASGYMLGEGRTSDIVCTHLLEEWNIFRDSADPTRGYVKAVITSFGLPAGHMGEAGENHLKLSLLLVDNKTVLDYDFPVGDSFRRGTETTLELEIDKTVEGALPDVKPEGGSAGGFDVKVDDWGDEEIIDIPV